MNLRKNNNSTGFVAITMVLLLGFTLTVLVFGSTQTSISTSLISQQTTKASSSQYLSDSCVELTLLQLSLSHTLPTQIQLPHATCQISTLAIQPNAVSFETHQLHNDQFISNSITASISGQISINKWIPL